MASLAFGSSSPEKQPVPRNKLRAIVVDDSLTILHLICSLLEHHEIVDVVGRAESGSETVDAVLNLQPDLVLMDADMPGMSGLRASLLLSQVSPETRVVLMSMDTTSQFRSACSGCGASGVIYKPKFLSELAQLLEVRPQQVRPQQQWHKSFPRPRRKPPRAVTYNGVSG